MLSIKQIDSLKYKSTAIQGCSYEGAFPVVTPRNIKAWRYNYKDHKLYK